MKTDRKIKAEPGSENQKINKKTRGPRAKSSSGTNGKSLLVTYEHAPIGIVECSLDGKHINANEEYCRFLGYEKEDLIGKGLKDITHEDDYPIDIKLHQQLIEGKIPFYRLEKRYLHKNGRSMWAELTRSVVRDRSGNPLYTVGVVLDISDRKQVERVLRESTERLRLATEAARMFTWELDLKTRMYTFADNFERVLGFSAGLLPKNSVETVERLSPAEDVQAFWHAFAKAVEQHRDLHSLQLRVINPETGETVWLEANAKIVYDDHGNAERMFGVAQNITENKKTQDEILIISRMPEESPNPVMRVTRDGNVLYANSPSASLLKSWERSAAHTIPDELQARVEEAFTSGLKQDVEIENDGKVFAATLAPIPEAGYVNFYGSDITERKRAEQSLQEFARQQQALYQLTDQLHRTNSLDDVFNAAFDAILGALQCDRASVLLFDDKDAMHFVAWRGLSDGYLKATDGHSPWKVDEKNPELICVNDVNTADLGDSLKAVIKSEGIGALAFIPLVANGRLIGKFMTYYNAPHVFSEDEVDFSLTIARQLAFGVDRKRSEEKLRQAAAFNEAVMGNMGEGLYTVDGEGKVTSMNPAAEKMFGWTFNELRGRRMHDATHYQHADGTPFPAEGCPGFQVLHHGQKLVSHEDVFIRKDGTFFDVIYSSSPLWDNGKINGLVVVFSDNTTRKQAEKRFVLVSEISELVRRLEDPNELLFAVSEAVGDYLQVRRCLFNEIDIENDVEIVHRDYSRGVESVAGIHKISDYSSVTSVEMAAGKTVVNHDSKTDPRTAPDYERSYVQHGERAYVTVPLMRENHWVASLWVSDDKPREWSEEEVSLLETIAERTWIAIEKLRLADELRAREAELEAIITQTPFMLTRCTRDLRYRFVSRAYAEMIGRTPKEIAGKSIVEIMGEEGIRTISPYIEKVLQGEYVEYENEVAFQGVGAPFLHVAYTPDWDESGNVVGWFASIVDISERKRTEKALYESEQRFREIFETAGVSVWLEDFTQVKTAIEALRVKGVQDFRTYFLQHPEFVQSAIDLVRVLDVNNETLDLFGAKNKNDLLGSLSNVFAYETEQVFVEELMALAEGRETLRAETQVRTLNGKPVSVLFTVHFASPTDDQSHVVVTLTDITERKRAEESLRASEGLYRTIARSIPGGGVYVVDKDMRYIVADGSVTEAFGFSREMLEGHTVSEVFRDEQSSRMVERLQRNFAGETVSYETEHNGRVYWTQQAPLVESIGQAIMVTLDITERKHAEEALRQSEERFAQFMEHLPGLAWIKDTQGRYVYANVTAEKAFSTPREKLYGRRDHDIFPPDVANQFKKNDEQALLERQGVQVVETLQQDDGILHYSLVSKFPIPGPDGNIELIGGTAFDITERRRAEEALQLLNLQLETRVVERTAELQNANSELLESRRRLQFLSQRLVEVQEEERRAIARELHDRVGQSLSALNINMIIMRDQLLPDSLARVGPRLDDSMHLVGETITLVRDVMSNLRPAVLDDYGLEAALQSHIDEYMSRYELKVVLERPAQPIPRLGSSIEMTFLRIAQEALMNIARHANASQVTLSLWPEGDLVCMTIQDNGSGIVSWQQANRSGSHGLTIMRERAEAFGGNLKVDSAPGKGTKIEMSIPVGKGNQNEIQKEMLE